MAWWILLRDALASAAVLVSGVLVPATPDDAAVVAEPSPAYVALGDSYATGSGLDPGSADDCGRTDLAYPRLLATDPDRPPVETVSEACDGATIEEVTRSQLNRLGPATELVTLSIGGNDIGFGALAGTCLSLEVRRGLGSSPPSTDLRPHVGELVDEGTCAGSVADADARLAEIRGGLERLLTAIATRAPQARILVLGYPSLLPGVLPADTGVCSLWRVALPGVRLDLGYLADDIARLRGLQSELARRQAAAVRAVSDRFGGRVHLVDLAASREGPLPCDGHGSNWIGAVDVADPLSVLRCLLDAPTRCSPSEVISGSQILHPTAAAHRAWAVRVRGEAPSVWAPR